jgi:glycosyltransferase involved in cell wall biosynthesis
LRGKALILTENLSVPFDRRVWQECRALVGVGLEVSVICPQGSKRDRLKFEEREGVRIHRYPPEWATGGPAGYAREYAVALWHTRRIALRLARTQQFDFVQACNPPDLLLPAVRALKREGAAFLFDHHDLAPELYESRFGRSGDLLHRLTLVTERLTFRLADVVIATNESYRRIALERGRKRPEDVFVVRSGPDLERFAPVEPDNALRRGKAHLLAYIGVMGVQDGVDHALRALARLRERRTDWHAIFVGDGDVQAKMRELAAGLGLGDVTEFPGRVPDDEVLRILSTADVCLAPDPKNPLNDVSTMNKIVEYMAMARPIVSYELAETRVSAGEAALYAESNDVNSFAACIGALLDDPERRRRMGEVGYSRVERELSWQHSQRELIRAYERALELGAPASGLRSGFSDWRRKRHDSSGGQVPLPVRANQRVRSPAGRGT